MIPDEVLLFVGLDALCLLLYLGRRRRRLAHGQKKLDYLGMSADI